MPFLTEEIWHALYAAIGMDAAPAKSIALTRFPLATDFTVDLEAERAMSLLQDVIVAVRAVRKEIVVPEKEAAPIRVFAAEIPPPNSFTQMPTCLPRWRVSPRSRSHRHR